MADWKKFKEWGTKYDSEGNSYKAWLKTRASGRVTRARVKKWDVKKKKSNIVPDVKVDAGYSNKKLVWKKKGRARKVADIKGKLFSRLRKTKSKLKLQDTQSQATAQAQTMAGAIEQAKNVMGDAAEEIGTALGPAVVSIAKELKFVAGFWAEWTGNINKNKTKEFSNEFEYFWKSYPRKIARKKCANKFDDLMEYYPIEEIQIGTQLWLDYWKQTRTEVKYIPHPYTFLTQERFMDMPDEIENQLDVEYRLDTTGKFFVGYCSKCEKSNFYRKEELSQDSKCCNERILPQRESIEIQDINAKA